MKISRLFLLLIGLSGCSTICKLCEPQVIVYDSISVIRKDSIVFVELPQEIKYDTIYIEQLDNLIDTTSTLKTSLAVSTATIKNSRLEHTLTQIDTTLPIPTQNTSTTHLRGTEAVIITNELHGWQWFLIYAAPVLFVILLVVIGWQRFASTLWTKLITFFKNLTKKK